MSLPTFPVHSELLARNSKWLWTTRLEICCILFFKALVSCHSFYLILLFSNKEVNGLQKLHLTDENGLLITVPIQYITMNQIKFAARRSKYFTRYTSKASVKVDNNFDGIVNLEVTLRISLEVQMEERNGVWFQRIWKTPLGPGMLADSKKP